MGATISISQVELIAFGLVFVQRFAVVKEAEPPTARDPCGRLTADG